VNHVAIDLGTRESQVCIRRPDGTVVREFKHPTRSLAGLMKSWELSRVVLETSSEAFAIADQALAANHEVRVVPATLVRSLGVGARGIKTDQRDAQVLSEVSCRIDLPSVHIPSTLSRELKSMCGSRETLVAARTQLVNNVRGWMRTALWQIRSSTTAAFPDRVRARALADGRTLPDHIERELVVIAEMNRQIRAADQQLKAFAKQHPVCQRLMTTPGVGPVTAVRYVAALDEVSRFKNAHAVAAYLGLTPGENSSSQRQQRTGITKAGPPAVRRVLVQGAWVVLTRCPNEPMVRWAAQIATRRGRFVAVVALARKMAGILFALWRDGTTYRSTHGARASLS
jgi:transposase